MPLNTLGQGRAGVSNSGFLRLEMVQFFAFPEVIHSVGIQQNRLGTQHDISVLQASSALVRSYILP